MNLWDIPAAPFIGDADIETLFASVGRALSRWEHTEGNMALLFARLVGGNYGAFRAYGTSTNVGSKRAMIEEAADVFFANRPAPEVALGLKTHLNNYANLAARRNDIAHGIAQPFAPGGYALFPAYHASRKRELVAEALAFEVTQPKYVYASAQIEIITNAFGELYQPTMQLISDVINVARLS